MTQEEFEEIRKGLKKLLLFVLKDGLPYGIQLQITDIDGFTFNGELRELSKNWCKLNITDPAKKARVKNEIIPLNYIYIKPFLRSMSSMTEEEKEKYHSLREIYISHDADANVTYHYFDTPESYDWLDAHHFDHRGLIETGFAIEVTKENNPYKE